MDFLTGKKPGSADPAGEHHEKSSSELFSSAKLVAEAAQSTLKNESDKVDKGKAAGAAADLLGAAKDYGKLGEEGVGKYVDQAEKYLHQYGSSNTTTTDTPTAVTEAAASATISDVRPPASGTVAKAPATVADAAAQSAPESEKENVNKDTVAKAAADSHQSQSSTVTDAVASAAADAPSLVSGGHKGNSGTDYLKMAQGFLGKH